MIIMEKNPISKSKALFIFLLTALFLCYEMGVQVSPSVMTQYLMQDLAITTVGLGFMSGFYFYTYTVMQIPAGLLFDRFKVRWVVILPLSFCALGTLVFSQAHSILGGSIGRLLMGAGSAFAFIAVLVVASDLFSAKRFALMTGLTQMLAAFGAMLGEAPLLPLIQHFGWRGTMLFLTGIAVILIILIAWFVRYEKCESFESCAPVERVPVFASLKMIASSKQSWWIASYACLLWAPMAAFASLWGVPLLEKLYGVDKLVATGWVALMWVGIAVGSPLIGWWSDFIKSRRLPLTLSGIIGFFSMLLVVSGSDMPHVLIAIALFFAGAACSGQALSFAVVNDNSLEKTRAAAIGFNNMAVVIAGAIFQPLVGILIKDQNIWNYQVGGGILALCFLVGALIAFSKIRSQQYDIKL